MDVFCSVLCYTGVGYPGPNADIRYFLDADTGQPHIYGHGVT